MRDSLIRPFVLLILLYLLILHACFEGALLFVWKEFLRKGLQVSKNVALANGEEHFTFVQLFQILVCRFFKGLVFIGRVAQLNRAFDYGSKGCRFESCRGHKKSLLRWEALFAFIGLM